ncbi:hypothetical protein LTR94_024638 [Friedmanniomyces endolithicus]|nr:hypothetical protein LTR94_024638 [Friedmanniomyces endolithicus]
MFIIRAQAICIVPCKSLESPRNSLAEVSGRSVDLADDRPIEHLSFTGMDGTLNRPNALHYAPYYVTGVRDRISMIARWIAEYEPDLMVIDVSVEVAMLARLAATPVVYVRLSGRRDDRAHLDAFRGAEHLLAPWHEDLEDVATPDWVRRKTRYFAPQSNRRPAPCANKVLVVTGRGGAERDGRALAAAARATPEWCWVCVGPVSETSLPPNLIVKGWVGDVAGEIEGCDVVIGGAGDGLINEVLSSGRPFICLPEHRAYGEQVSKAQGLECAGAAIIRADWPQAHLWPKLLDQALALSPKASDALCGEGLSAAGRWLVDTAKGLRSAVL